jgi:hypothetical protein
MHSCPECGQACYCRHTASSAIHNRMHSCPECGQACYCGGDFDDIELEEDEDDCIHCLGVEDGDDEGELDGMMIDRKEQEDEL